MTDCNGVLLSSGGMDSTVLAYDLARQGANLILLFLDYGQHCMKKEYETLKRVAPKAFMKNITLISIVDIFRESKSRMIVEADLWFDEVAPSDLYLPYRNLLFLSIASAYAQSIGIRNVYAAFINSNHAKEIDCSIRFFTQLEAMLEEYGSVKINIPYREMSKTQVANLGVELGAPIAETFSCQVNSVNPCGVCPNCVDRINAMRDLLKEV